MEPLDVGPKTRPEYQYSQFLSVFPSKNPIRIHSIVNAAAQKPFNRIQ